jgi:hypothetical protein
MGEDGVIWPAVSGTYKAVQLEFEGYPHLLLGLRDQTHHAFLLEEFLEMQEASYERMRTITGKLVPQKAGSQYQVYGMGVAELNVEKRCAYFYGSSVDYDMGINHAHLERMKAFFGDWLAVNSIVEVLRSTPRPAA